MEEGEKRQAKTWDKMEIPIQSYKGEQITGEEVARKWQQT